MLKLKANFAADWIAHLRTQLVNVQGWPADEVAALDDRDARIHYFDGQRRRIARAPRAIKIADDFACPSHLEDGWKSLQEKVRKGEDINAHLSKRHVSLFNPDGLLAEWGVHHFHLGVVPDSSDPDYVARTGSLVYALVDLKTFCAINVYTHQGFEDTSVVESIHRNWPQMISRYCVKRATGAEWSRAERRKLRSKNANSFIATADGTVYMPISGGVMASGVNAEAVRLADYWQDRIQQFQADFERQLDGILPTLRQQGLSIEDEVEATLNLSSAGIQVFFPKYDVLASVILSEEGARGPPNPSCSTVP